MGDYAVLKSLAALSLMQEGRCTPQQVSPLHTQIFTILAEYIQSRLTPLATINAFIASHSA
jgi:hypothetical protein